ncbi:MAG: exodeoxyribonuclease VII small subunit [Gemmatimonadales bacterium]|jgi:exodeoxyribonuclease VII small subunit
MTTIERRLARLDEIVAELEGDRVELARALELFEEGVGCLRDAAGSLAAAEARVQKLTELADGALGVEALDGDA